MFLEISPELSKLFTSAESNATTFSKSDFQKDKLSFFNIFSVLEIASKKKATKPFEVIKNRFTNRFIHTFFNQTDSKILEE